MFNSSVERIHLAKTLLYCIGKFIQINGLFDTLIETGTFGAKRA